MFGAVSSMLMFDTVNVAVLPALSVIVPTTDWFAPSPSVVGELRLAAPESASAPLKLTLTRAFAERARTGNAEQARKGIAVAEAHGYVRVVPVVGVGRAIRRAADHRRGLVDIDVRDRVRRGVARLIFDQERVRLAGALAG